MRYFVSFPGGGEIPVDITHLATGGVIVEVDGQRVEADGVDVANGVMSVRVDGRIVDLWMEGLPPEVGVVAGDKRFFARVESERMRAVTSTQGPRGGGEGLLVSPMPGRVLKLLVSEGDEVTAGTPIIVVEAMKMENELSAARDGRVAKIFVAAGDTVESGTKLLELA